MGNRGELYFPKRYKKSQYFFENTLFWVFFSQEIAYGRRISLVNYYIQGVVFFMGRALTENGRPAKKGRLTTAIRKFVLFAAGMSILYLVAVQGLHWAGFKMIETSTLGRGELKKMYPAGGIIIRDETVITAPADGELVMLVEEGDRVRAGDSVAEIKTAGADPGVPGLSALVSATRTGVVSLGVDGLEGLLKPGQADIFDAARLPESPTRMKGDGSRQLKCTKGQPVLKIIDNLSPLMICVRVPGGLPPEASKKGDVFIVREGRETSGRIVEAGSYDGGTQLVLEVSNYSEEYLSVRNMSMELVGERVNGFIVPSDALAVKDGGQGLYLMDRDEAQWVPVKVDGAVDGSSAVSGADLTPGGRYVINPRWLIFAGD
ncbi:MAG: hypothetical protein JL50_19020 [Peptococcaceae bacterium BICA1-7]|nr:MAG: hypothetical protein JL50_19020 [Peptococcaceae bacterium BICA1-7]HBV98969.1 hypothetical protein [Desulfotomaculum sp.]